jgi:hypothetical protein
LGFFWGRGGFLGSVLTMFSSCSQGVPIRFWKCCPVPNVFPKMCPITLHILSHIVWLWFNFHVSCKGVLGGGVLERGGKGGVIEEWQSMLLFWEGNIFRVLCCPKSELVMGQSNGSLWKTQMGAPHH